MYLHEPGKIGNDHFLCYISSPDNSHLIEYPYTLANSQVRLPSKGAPGVKLSCEVFVYIHPKNCDDWILGYGAASPVPPSAAYMSVQIPEKHKLSLLSKTNVTLHSWQRSGNFLVMVGRGSSVGQDIEANMFSAPFHQSRVTNEPVKIFIHAVYIQGETYVMGMYLVLRPRNKFNANEYMNRWMSDTYGRVTETSFRLIQDYHYVFQELTEGTLVTIFSLEQDVTNNMRTQEIVWVFNCDQCILQPNQATNTLDQYSMKDWNVVRQHELEILTLYNIFTNSSMMKISFLTTFAPSFTINDNFNYLIFSPRTKTAGFYFVTCANFLEIGPLTLIGYVMAFDKTTWIFIFAASVATFVVLIKVVRGETFDKLILLPLYILLEQGCIEGTPKKLRWITAVWILMGIVLSNIYKGDNITSLIAPLPLYKLEEFDQLISREFVFRMKSPWNVLLFLVSTFQSPLVDAFLVAYQYRKFDLLRNISMESLINLYIHNHFPTFSDSSERKMTAVLESSLSPANILDDSAEISDFLPQLAECLKEAYVGHFEEVKRVSFTLNKILVKRGGKKFVSMGKEALTDITKVWTLEQVQMPATPFFIRIHSLWHSGLIYHWEAWKLRLNLWAVMIEDARLEYEMRLPKGLKLDDNVIVVFYMYLILVTLSLTFFLYEVRTRLYTCGKDYLPQLANHLCMKFRVQVCLLRNVVNRIWKGGKSTASSDEDASANPLQVFLSNENCDLSGSQDGSEDIVALQSLD